MNKDVEMGLFLSHNCNSVPFFFTPCFQINVHARHLGKFDNDHLKGGKAFVNFF